MGHLKAGVPLFFSNNSNQKRRYLMEDVLNVAAYISQRYFLEYNEQMDEMKLHKLMYLIQREAIIQTGEPLFNATFYGWTYGPVLK